MFELDRHVITLEAGGRMRQPGGGVSPREAIQRILEGFADSGSSSMTIYFHGGVVSEPLAHVLAQRLYPEITENFDSYPVFVIWKSGLLETIQSALLDIQSSSPLFLSVVKKLARWVALLARDEGLAERKASSPEELPLEAMLAAMELEQLPLVGWESLDALVHGERFPAGEDSIAAFQQAMADDPVADQALGAIISAAQIKKETPDRSEMEGSAAPATAVATGHLSRSIVDRLAEEVGSSPENLNGRTTAESWFFAGDVLRAILERFAEGTDHGYLGTILEEMYRTMYADKVGRFLWDEMKQNAADAYGPITAESIPGGTLFLEEVKAFMEENERFDLNLIGHSAGSIHIAHFIDAGVQRMPDLFSLDNVVFLAPACSFELFKSKMVPYDAYIGNFRIFTMSDGYERRDPLVKIMPLLYPHSLLYLVSGLFEDEPDTPLIG
ncbi:MAG: hypothetical protein ACK2UK_13935, partial [Candidatus Promineifilaceae bacterium]